jgi:hypothetical protein
MGVTNSDMADRAFELAEVSGGLRRMAALCVSAAAATTGTARTARRALEVIPHVELRAAARSVLAELAEEQASEG